MPFLCINSITSQMYTIPAEVSSFIHRDAGEKNTLRALRTGRAFHSSKLGV